RGYTAENAARWALHGIGPADADNYRRLGLDPDGATDWRRHGFSSDFMAGYQECGLTPDEASEWHARGLLHRETQKPVQRGTSLDDAVSPGSAWRWTDLVSRSSVGGAVFAIRRLAPDELLARCEEVSANLGVDVKVVGHMYSNLNTAWGFLDGGIVWVYP